MKKKTNLWIKSFCHSIKYQKKKKKPQIEREWEKLNYKESQRGSVTAAWLTSTAHKQQSSAPTSNLVFLCDSLSFEQQVDRELNWSHFLSFPFTVRNREERGAERLCLYRSLFIYFNNDPCALCRSHECHWKIFALLYNNFFFLNI